MRHSLGHPQRGYACGLLRGAAFLRSVVQLRLAYMYYAHDQDVLDWAAWPACTTGAHDARRRSPWGLATIYARFQPPARGAARVPSVTAPNLPWPRRVPGTACPLNRKPGGPRGPASDTACPAALLLTVHYQPPPHSP